MAEGNGFVTTSKRMGRDLAIGGLVCVFVVGGAGGWAATAKIGGAVIAPGQVVVSSNVKTVQHRDGGIVGEIHVENGSPVSPGDLLIRLDATAARARKAILDAELVALEARSARLDAEREEREELLIPAGLIDRGDEPHVAEAIAGERRVLAAVRETLAGQIEQLDERKAQLAEEIVGLSAQRDAKDQEIALIGEELVGLRSLLANGHVPKTRVMALERNAVRLKGEYGELIARIAMTEGRISETELQILQLSRDTREEALGEIREVATRISDLRERLIAAEDDLRRIDIRAPAEGVVHELAVHTVGGVIAPGAAVLQLVPHDDRLVIDARVAPTDIEQLHVGQSATVSLNAFDMRQTPQLNGRVLRVSPDLSEDERTGASYYTVRISLSDAEIERLDGKQLVPGMPAEVFIQTRERTVMAYLLEPLETQIRRTFRES